MKNNAFNILKKDGNKFKIKRTYHYEPMEIYDETNTYDLNMLGYYKIQFKDNDLHNGINKAIEICYKYKIKNYKIGYRISEYINLSIVGMAIIIMDKDYDINKVKDLTEVLIMVSR